VCILGKFGGWGRIMRALIFTVAIGLICFAAALTFVHLQ
jgi:hypothetical protein